MPSLTVELGSDSYPIIIESGLLADSCRLGRLLQEHCPGQGATVVISNDKVWGLFGATIKAGLSDDFLLVRLDEGEQAKSIDSYHRIITEMLQARCTRDSRILAVGGGIVGDVAGFVAATYMRGINYVQLPTTLLAQVDSSVGGKTAINHELAKNTVGAFKQPRVVLMDPDCLAHLDERQLRAGVAEVLKYAFINDKQFCTWLEANIESLSSLKTEAVQHAIEISCHTKASIVAQDERDLDGRRALLNFGHSFGHALEKTGDFNQWLHGEAVACGMAMAARFSRELGLLDTDQEQRIASLIERAGLAIQCPQTDAVRMLEAMRLDKKNTGSQIRLVLLRAIGDALLQEVAIDDLRDFLDRYIDSHAN